MRIAAGTSIDAVRAERDKRLQDVLWAVDRDNQRRELTLPSALPEDRRLALLRYIEDLRRVPEIYAGTGRLDWPKTPDF